MPRRNAIPKDQRQAEARERAIAALALMRRQPGTSVLKAAGEYSTTRKTVLKYVGSELKRKRLRGKYKPTTYDRLSRRINIITPHGSQPETVRDSRIATANAEHSNAVRIYRNTGDTTALEKFRGKSFRVSGRTYEFVTDPDVLDRLGDAGLFPENFYQPPGGAGV